MPIFTVTRRDDGAALFAVDAATAEEAASLIAGQGALGALAPAAFQIPSTDGLPSLPRRRSWRAGWLPSARRSATR